MRTFIAWHTFADGSTLVDTLNTVSQAEAEIEFAVEAINYNIRAWDDIQLLSDVYVTTNPDTGVRYIADADTHSQLFELSDSNLHLLQCSTVSQDDPEYTGA
jgi:hypothetical protein